jgi:hypothetical protein
MTASSTRRAHSHSSEANRRDRANRSQEAVVRDAPPLLDTPFRSSMALTEPANAFSRTPLPTVPNTKPRKQDPQGALRQRCRRRLVARIARLHLRLGSRLSVLVELRVPPARRRGVLLRVLDHELQVPVRGRPGYEGLGAAEDLVVLLRRNVRPGNPGDCHLISRLSRSVHRSLVWPPNSCPTSPLA